MISKANMDEWVPSPGGTPDLSGPDNAMGLGRLMSGCVQDPSNHAEGDVWTHVQMVCSELVSSPEYAAETLEGRFVLFYAALFHDLGKPSKRREEDGRVTFRGHSLLGAGMARVFMWRAGVPFGEREEICSMIAAHQTPFHPRLGEDGGMSARRLAQGCRLDRLAVLARADARGRICNEPVWSGEDSARLFEEEARDAGCLSGPFAFPDERTRAAYFQGRSVDPYHSLFFDGKGSTVTMLCGLPASGKDTYSEAAGLPVISLDAEREESGAKRGADGAAVRSAREKARKLLAAGEDFVWNATNVSPRTRAMAAGLFFGYGAGVRAVYIERPEDAMRASNAKRDSGFPDSAYEGLYARWSPPSVTEGFLSVENLVETAPSPKAGRRHGF